MTSTPDIRVALIGYGLAGASFHAPFITTTDGLKLVSIVTRDTHRRSLAAAEHPGVTLLDTADALWAAPDSADLVVIATPNRWHVPLGLAALDAGFHVVVDKPIAAAVADAERLIAASRERGRLLSVYQNRRWDGDFQTVKKLVDEGQLGEVLRFESRFERWRPEPRADWRELADPAEAGGLLFDLGTHLIDQALVLFGEITAVYAELDRRRVGSPVDDDVFVALTHASGVRSHLHISMHALEQAARFRLLGRKATYTKYGTDVQEAALRRGAKPTKVDWGEEPRADWGTIVTPEASRALATERGNYAEFYRGMASAVRDGTPVPVDPQDAVTVLRVIAAAQRSAAEGRLVKP